MPFDAIAELQAEITEWRHELHANPELLYDVHRTAAFVAAKLKITVTVHLMQMPPRPIFAESAGSKVSRAVGLNALSP
jgi:metal-dependent amidase/aminoacylase/carboxypeptidase family protein